jgi:6-methylsalicylate decarboxylase
LIDKMVYSHRGMPATDVHQHLWPEPLLGLLAARSQVPRLRRHTSGWELELAGEAPSVVDLRSHDPVARAELARADGVERVLVAPSAPLGIESLPDAQPLLDAFHDGVHALGEPFAAWGSIALATPDPADVDALVAAGAAGLCLPAAALGGPHALDHIGPVLERLATHRAPLLVHPGPAPATAVAARPPFSPADDPASRAAASRGWPPGWWPAMTSYVAEMQAAWLAWAAWGRAAHPDLKVVWAMLAGGAPLHAERLAARGGPAGAVLDDRAWFDVSSYGPRAVDAMLRVVGVDRLVLGSDRPVADPPSLAPLGLAVRHAVAKVNPSIVLDRS